LVDKDTIKKDVVISAKGLGDIRRDVTKTGTHQRKNWRTWFMHGWLKVLHGCSFYGMHPFLPIL
jgi:hypothetical protein